MILLADTSILIDLEYVGGIEVLPQLAPCEVLDVVLVECEHGDQPDLVQKIIRSGITVIETSFELAERATAMRRRGVSTNDMMTVCYAQEHDRVVLAGDRSLRERCEEEGVDFRGSIWIVQEAHRLGLVNAVELLRWLSVWPTVGRRLPPEEIEKLRQKLSVS
ncbi:PIN domain-containing protein [Geotalea uraniireducens]|uniref:PIN domain-containing protein n=1 Tax=Geotalea uraniireducens TaxID=351604 RepID=UPI00059D156A|nr:PIN domain-containing protein [Geotalea uraniireducens]